MSFCWSVGLSQGSWGFTARAAIHACLDQYADIPQTQWDSPSAVSREVKKIINIISKSIYSELLGKIREANNALKTLIDQTHQLEGMRSSRQQSRRPFVRCKAAQEHALNLYNVVIRGSCWKCPCKSAHRAHLRIEPFEDNEQNDADSIMPNSRVAFSSRTSSDIARLPWHWQEVATVPDPVSTPAIDVCATPST